MNKSVSIMKNGKPLLGANPDYVTDPVPILPYGLAPPRSISRQHDPSIGYRSPSTSNITRARPETSATNNDVDDEVDDVEWRKRKDLLQSQHEFESGLEQESQKRYQKLRLLSMRSTSPLRAQQRTRNGRGTQIEDSVALGSFGMESGDSAILVDDRRLAATQFTVLDTPSLMQNNLSVANKSSVFVDAPNHEATLVPLEKRYVIKNGETDVVLPPLEADASVTDVALVEEWADKVERYLNKRYKRESWEYIEEAQLFYNAYSHESIRRVEVLDTNLGRSMGRVMKSYDNMFDRVVQLTKEREKEALASFNAQLQAMQDAYDERFAQIMQNVANKADEIGTGLGKKNALFGGKMGGKSFFKNAAKRMSLGMRLGRHVNKNRREENMLKEAMNHVHDLGAEQTSKYATNEDDSDVDEDDTGDKSDSTDTELKKRKKLLSSKRFSGVDKKLEKLHDDLLTSAGQTPVLNQFDSTGDSAEWIRLSGATADINHMSAWAMTNVDLTHILKRGQRIRIGPKRFLINQDGDFYPSGLPLDEIWMGAAASDLPIYIQKQDNKSEYDDGSDMEPDDDEEWHLVPATGTVVEGESCCMTSMDVRSFFKRGAHVKLGRQVFHVGSFGTFSDDEFPLSHAWIGKGQRNIPIFVMEEFEENIGKTIEEAPVVDTTSPWVTLHGVTVSLKSGVAVATCHADLRNVLHRGKLVSIDHEIFTIDRGADFTTTEIPLDAPWPHEDREGVQIKLRRRDSDAQINLLSNSLKILGLKLDQHTVQHVEQGTQTDDALEHQDRGGLHYRMVPLLGGVHEGPKEMCDASMQTDKVKRKKMSAASKADKAAAELKKCLLRFKALPKKKQKFTPKPLVLKEIAMIMGDRFIALKEDPDSDESMSEYIVDWFFHKYGMKKLADKQLGKLLASMEKIKNHPRVHFFQKLLGIHVDASSNIHNPLEMKRAFRCLTELKRTPLNGIHTLTIMHKEGAPLECSMVAAFESVRKGLVRSTLYKQELVFDHNTWPDLKTNPLPPPEKLGSTHVGSVETTVDSFLTNAYQRLAFLAREAPDLDKKVEAIRSFLYVKRSLGDQAREDYKRFSHKSLYLYTFVEFYVRLLRESCRLEAAAVRNQIRQTFRTVGEGLEGAFTFDEFKLLLNGCLGQLAGSFNKKKAMRLYKQSMTSKEAGIITEESFLDVVDDCFNDEQLAELVRKAKKTGAAASKGKLDEKDGRKMHRNLSAWKGELMTDATLLEMNEKEKIEARGHELEEEALADVDNLDKDSDIAIAIMMLEEEQDKNAANYEILREAWEDVKEEVDELIFAHEANKMDNKGIQLMVSTLETSMKEEDPLALEQSWSHIRTLTTMARREKGYVALSTTLRVKRFVAKLRAKSAVSSLTDHPRRTPDGAAAKIQAIQRGRKARKDMMERQLKMQDRKNYGGGQRELIDSDDD